MSAQAAGFGPRMTFLRRPRNRGGKCTPHPLETRDMGSIVAGRARRASLIWVIRPAAALRGNLGQALIRAKAAMACRVRSGHGVQPAQARPRGPPVHPALASPADRHRRERARILVRFFAAHLAIPHAGGPAIGCPAAVRAGAALGAKSLAISLMRRRSGARHRDGTHCQKCNRGNDKLRHDVLPLLSGSAYQLFGAAPPPIQVAALASTKRSDFRASL